MAADIELLPLPPHFSHQHDNVKKIVREYAIANMAELADDRDDLLARLDASIDHGTKLGAAQQRCLDEVLEQQAEIEALRAALESLKAHKENAIMNQKGIIKALSEARDELGDEIHRLRAELKIAKGQSEFYRTERNKCQRKAERLAEALREKADKWDRISDEHGVRQFTGNDHRLFANELRALLRDHDQERE